MFACARAGLRCAREHAARAGWMIAKILEEPACCADSSALRRAPARSWPELTAVAVALMLYARSAGFDLVFDDHSLIGEQGPRMLGGDWLPYRPLRFASLWL